MGTMFSIISIVFHLYKINYLIFMFNIALRDLIIRMFKFEV